VYGMLARRLLLFRKAERVRIFRKFSLNMRQIHYL
jgi:hypothetical protein